MLRDTATPSVAFAPAGDASAPLSAQVDAPTPEGEAIALAAASTDPAGSFAPSASAVAQPSPSTKVSKAASVADAVGGDETSADANRGALLNLVVGNSDPTEEEAEIKMWRNSEEDEATAVADEECGGGGEEAVELAVGLTAGTGEEEEEDEASAAGDGAAATAEAAEEETMADEEEEAAANDACPAASWDEAAREAAFDVATAAVYMSAFAARSALGYVLSLERALVPSRGSEVGVETFALSPSPLAFRSSPVFMNDSSTSSEDDSEDEDDDDDEAYNNVQQHDTYDPAPTTLTRNEAPSSPTQRRKQKILMKIVRIAAQAEEKRERKLELCEPAGRAALEKSFAKERRTTQREIKAIVAGMESDAQDVARRRRKVERVIAKRREAARNAQEKEARKKRAMQRRRIGGVDPKTRKMLSGTQVAMQKEVYKRMGMTVTGEQAQREREIALRSGRRQLGTREVIEMQHQRTDLLRQLSGVMREEQAVIQRLSRAAPAVMQQQQQQQQPAQRWDEYAMPAVVLPKVVPKFVGGGGGGGSRGSRRAKVPSARSSRRSSRGRAAPSLPALNFARLNK